MASSPLEFEDLSRTCRRDSFCLFCTHAFCSHCCGSHHRRALHSVIPVDVDGRPVFSYTSQLGGSQRRLPDIVVRTIAAEDYTTPLRRDSYCTGCKKIFCAGACHDMCGPCAVLRIEEHGGTHCVRCTGFEPWFPDVESYLGDPVGEKENKLLLPVLRRAPGTCVQCGAQCADWAYYIQHCSPPCDTAHRREVAQRRSRRDAWRAARQLAELQMH